MSLQLKVKSVLFSEPWEAFRTKDSFATENSRFSQILDNVVNTREIF